MELCHFLLGITKILPVLPSVPLYTIAFPLDQVLKFSSEHPTVQNLFHNIFLFSVDKFWWRQWVPTPSDNRVIQNEG